MWALNSWFLIQGSGVMPVTLPKKILDKMHSRVLTNLTKFSIHSLSLGAKRPLKVWMEMDSEACAEQAPVLLSRHCEALHNGFGG